MEKSAKKRKKRTGKKGNHLGTRQKELLIAEVELLLSEKRTSLSTLRTGIGLLPIPLTVFMVSLATSEYYPEKFYFILYLILIFCVSLLFIGMHLIQSSMRHIHHIDGKIRKLRKKDVEVGRLIEEAAMKMRF